MPLTAWKGGFRIGAAQPGGDVARILLTPLPAEDNPAYVWQPAGPAGADPHACANCHRAIHEEWAGSAHARSARNPRVLSLINGEDVAGVKHDTWNLKKEHPLGAGVCSRCHAPTYRSLDLDYDLEKVSGVAASGVHCDLCHKVTDVPTDKLGTRFGIDGLRLLRPQDDELIFYGPLKDAVRAGESFGYFPVYKHSRFCASCHEGTIFGVKVYGTYSEWQESPAGRHGVHCQDCHMAPSGKLTNIAPGHGGVERDPHTLATHGTPGGDAAMLGKSVRCEVEAEATGALRNVKVQVRASGVGHRVPTGFIDRHLVLIVEAWDGEGAELRHVRGEMLPPRLGMPWQGRAGWIYGRWLLDEAGRRPLPFWLPADKEVDTRLRAEEADVRSFSFPRTAAKSRVRLVYRRFWPELARERGWENSDLVIVDKTVWWSAP